MESVASGTPVSTPVSTPDTRPLQGLLPSDFGGAEAHTFAVGQDLLARLTEQMSLAPTDLEVAFASDHGAAFVQMYAVRVAGHSADEILAALTLVAISGHGARPHHGVGAATGHA